MSFFIRKYIKNIKPAGIAKAIMKISKYVNINNIDDPPSIPIIYFLLLSMSFRYYNMLICFLKY